MATPTLPLLLPIFVSVLTLSVLAEKSIPLGSTLSTSTNSKWISPNGDFAFGFRNVTPAGPYLVAIWFDNISDKTIVWTAKTTDFQVEEGSILSLSASGLRLLDSQQKPLAWSAKGLNTSFAVMQDDGNFALFDANQNPTWQSFDSPTDTLLPGQSIKSTSFMFSKVSDTNYSSGRFSLVVQEDGNLVLQPTEHTDMPDSGAYWSHNNLTDGTDDPSSLSFNSSGLLYLLNSTNEIVLKYPPANAVQGRVFRRVTLDTDGILKQYVWKEAENTTTSWMIVWQALVDPCLVTLQCGSYGVCRLNDGNSADCLCPPGYVFLDPADRFKGCRETWEGDESCTANNNTTMSMREMNNTDWPSGNYYSNSTAVTDTQCKQDCMEDSRCSVAVYGVSNDLICWRNGSPRVGGRQGDSITSRVFVKFCEGYPKQKRGKKGKVVVVILIALAGCACAALVAAGLIIWLRRRPPKATKNDEGLSPKAIEIDDGPKAFSYREIEAATRGFTEKIGKGGFGVVYKGTLSDGRAIAVKKLKMEQTEDSGGENEIEFRQEMRLIGNSHHKNLVQLYGFCHEGSHRLLVLEYMSNGSLDKFLFAGKFLDWKLRVKIATDIARGILYLHDLCRRQIIHCDIKPQNILLDENHNAKIADFGIAKLMTADQTRAATRARGTIGYMAPEWFKNQKITAGVDVYSFGVMLLEIICCRKSTDMIVPEDEVFLFEWVYKCFKKGRLETLVERQQEEGESTDMRQLERMVMVGIWCIQEDPVLRPSMKNVAGMLEGTITIQVPPCPTIAMPESIASPSARLLP